MNVSFKSFVELSQLARVCDTAEFAIRVMDYQLENSQIFYRSADDRDQVRKLREDTIERFNI